MLHPTRALRRPIIATVALTLACAPISAPAALAVPQRPAAPTPPRHCLAEYTTVDAKGVLTPLVYENGRFGADPMTGTKVSPVPRLARTIETEVTPTSASVTTLAVSADGTMRSVVSTLRDVDSDKPVWSSAAPARVGSGWQSVRDIVVPSDVYAPYLFAVSGSRLNRYTFHVSAAKKATVRTGPAAAATGFATVRSLTWTREATVRGARADVLVGLDGARLMEYTVPRVDRPRVTTRILGNSGWGRVSRITAGACFTSTEMTSLTRTTPLIGRIGTEARLYLDANNTDGSGRDIRNHGRVGTWP